ncbi:phage/plasmid primase, P4 family [Vulcanisaeta distributa]|uniref:DNA primase family protein n=1 Tax=Vulcanisaeta distributa TaxID=164451 RepID=UPI0006D069D9|nr:phage/plasmid primase, P4 family [Vulcanisaeta distributa]
MSISFDNYLFDWEEFLAKPLISKIGDSVEIKLVPDFMARIDWSAVTRQFLFKHNPKRIVFNYIPHKVDEEVLKAYVNRPVTYDDLKNILQSKAPRLLKFLTDWVDDKWPLLLEITGFSLYPRYEPSKAVMLLGDGANGKSTFLTWLRCLLGSENVSSISLQVLTDPSNRFAVAELYHKLANIYPDLPRTIVRDTGMFKALTGGDAIQAERKFRDPFVFVNYAKLIFSANEPPMVTDQTYAFWRRWIVIEFPHQFPPENPPNLKKCDFLSGREYAVWAAASILAFREVLRRGKFSFEGTHEDAKRAWLARADSVYAFIDAMIRDGYLVEESDGHVPANDLYNMYVLWCKDNDRDDEVVSKQIFTARMEQYGYRKVTIHGERYYKGLRLVKQYGSETSSNASDVTSYT